MEKRHRVFVAINLPSDVKKALEKHQKSIQEEFAGLGADGDFSGVLKWTDKDNLHITLEFLGFLTDQEIVEAGKVVGDIAKKHEAFSINLNKICYAARRQAKPTSAEVGLACLPKMIWAEGDLPAQAGKSEDLAELKKDLKQGLTEVINYKTENRGFVPHITLGRIKEWQFKQINPDERPEINKDINLIFSAESIEVMESQLKRGGPRYTVLKSCSFGN